MASVGCLAVCRGFVLQHCCLLRDGARLHRARDEFVAGVSGKSTMVYLSCSALVSPSQLDSPTKKANKGCIDAGVLVAVVG